MTSERDERIGPDILAALQEVIIQNAPWMQDVFKQKTAVLGEYVNNVFSKTTQPTPLLLEATKAVLQRYYSNVVADEIIAELALCPVVSSGQHYGFPFDPLDFQCNIMQAISCHDRGLKYAPVFACSRVKLDNPTQIGAIRPRGATQSVNLFRAKAIRSQLAFNAPAIGRDGQDVAFEKEFDVRIKSLPPSFQAMLKDPGFRLLPSFVHQVSNAVYDIYSVPAATGQMAQVVYISAEEVATEILLRKLPDGDPEVCRLFTTDGMGKINQLLADAGFSDQCCLFWAQHGDKFYPVDLVNGTLCGKEGAISFPLSVKDVISRLESRVLVLNKFMTYAMICHEGLLCVGGPLQMDYLPRMAPAWRAMFPTTRWRAEDSCRMLLGLAPCVDAQTLKAATLETAARDPAEWRVIVKTLRSTDMDTALKLALPELYVTCVPRNRQDPVLAKVTVEDILKLSMFAKNS